MSQPQLRWGEEAPTTVADARLRLIDAALACIDANGLAKTTLEDVATGANVSRQTVYRYFADRDELLVEALLTELERHAGPDPSTELVRNIATPADAVAALVEGAVFTLEAIAANPKLHALLESEGDTVRSTIEGASRLLFRHQEAELRPWLELGQATGFLNATLDVGEIVEWMLRITLSLMTVEGPVERDGAELRRFLRTFLTPVLAGSGRPTDGT